MINSREIADLSPDAQACFYRFKSHVERETGLIYGTDWTVISTYRDQPMQDHLWAQGRTDPGPIVTWTQNSRHTSRRAWDVMIERNGAAIWRSPEYTLLADVGRKMGLVCGMDFRKRDPGHFETPEVIA